MEKYKSLLDQMIENDPRLKKIYDRTYQRLKKAAEKERKLSAQAEVISAEDLAVVVNATPENSLPSGFWHD